MEKELNDLKKQVKQLIAENNELKRLINDHAARINKNRDSIFNLDRTLRSELSRIQSAFKKIQSVMRGGR